MNAIELDAKYSMQVYNRFKIVLARGEGARVWDDRGREYIDCTGGVAVLNIGHCHPAVVRALREQAGRLWQASNWYYTSEQAGLCAELAKIAPMKRARAFLCNSGAEAVEAAFKLARKATKKKEIITMEDGFHGRTMGALSLTWKPKYRQPFEPLVPGVRRVPFNNAGAVRKAINEETAAVIVEPIQGEGGVNVPSEGYLRELRELCSERDVLLIADEVQTGFGRCGRMFASQLYGVEPDIVCVAKGIAGGFPMGGMLARGDVAEKFEKGDHGSTFGGNSLACAAALASIRVIRRERLAEKAAKNGARFLRRLGEIKSGLIKEVRGKGLLVGVELRERARPYCERLAAARVLSSCPSDFVVRFTPPLVASEKELETVAEKFERVVRKGG
ncbi:MAG: aspartate aminotransferase family protein [Candidatus Micrarchaeia archaeon]